MLSDRVCPMCHRGLLGDDDVCVCGFPACNVPSSSYSPAVNGAARRIPHVKLAPPVHGRRRICRPHPLTVLAFYTAKTVLGLIPISSAALLGAYSWEAAARRTDWYILVIPFILAGFVGVYGVAFIVKGPRPYWRR